MKKMKDLTYGEITTKYDEDIENYILYEEARADAIEDCKELLKYIRKQKFKEVLMAYSNHKGVIEYLKFKWEITDEEIQDNE